VWDSNLLRREVCTAVAASVSSAGALCHRYGECPMQARSGICSGVSNKQQQAAAGKKMQ